MSTQVASKKNREAAARTNTRERRNRIAMEVATGSNNSGDFSNSSSLRSNNPTLMQQNFGNHNARYRDLVAAFGRLRPGEQLGVADGNGNGTATSARRSGLVFSAG